MFASQRLSKPHDVLGHRAQTLEDAAYYVRQHVIATDDCEGRCLVRQLREAIYDDEIALAEIQLGRWLNQRHRLHAVS